MKVIFIDKKPLTFNNLKEGDYFIVKNVYSDKTFTPHVYIKKNTIIWNKEKSETVQKNAVNMNNGETTIFRSFIEVIKGDLEVTFNKVT